MSLDAPFARTLRQAQKTDVRTQYGAVPWRLRRGKVQVCLITTRTTRRWMVPKGWPVTGRTPAEAAAAEAFEEAGLQGRINDRCVGLFTYAKELEDGSSVPCIVALYALKVGKVRKDWPEARERTRRWTTPKKAAAMVTEPELAQVLRGFDPR